MQNLCEICFESVKGIGISFVWQVRLYIFLAIAFQSMKTGRNIWVDLTTIELPRPVIEAVVWQIVLYDISLCERRTVKQY